MWSFRNFDWVQVIGLCVLALCAFAILSTVEGQRAMAQDADEDVVPDEEPAPAAEAQPPAAAASNAPVAPKKKSYLAWAYNSLGLGYSLIFLALSFALVALFVMNLLASMQSKIAPAELIEEFKNQLNNKKYQEAYDLAKNDESFLGLVLSAGLSKISSGYAPAIEAMQEVGEEENMRLEHRLSYLALIGTICPMVGLLGTVQGMIAAFEVIATAATAPKPAELAAGISTALFTTLIGLAIAIPAIAAYNILRNVVARRVLQVGITSESLMGRFQKRKESKPE